MPNVFGSFAKLVGTKLDELPGGIFKSRCEIRTIGAAFDQLQSVVSAAEAGFAADRSIPSNILRVPAHQWLTLPGRRGHAERSCVGATAARYMEGVKRDECCAAGLRCCCGTHLECLLCVCIFEPRPDGVQCGLARMGCVVWVSSTRLSGGVWSRTCWQSLPVCEGVW